MKTKKIQKTKYYSYRGILIKKYWCADTKVSGSIFSKCEFKIPSDDDYRPVYEFRNWFDEDDLREAKKWAWMDFDRSNKLEWTKE